MARIQLMRLYRKMTQSLSQGHDVDYTEINWRHNSSSQRAFLRHPIGPNDIQSLDKKDTTNVVMRLSEVFLT